MGFEDYIKIHDSYLVQNQSDRVQKLPSAPYLVKYIPDMDQLIFEQIKFTHDNLLELPSREFQTVVKQIDKFREPETKAAFNEFGFVYKRSILMHGLPGTGKTCLISRISDRVVAEGGIVLFNPDPHLLPKAYKALEEIQPETQIVVVFEELDRLMHQHEGALLNLLDGEVQRDNVIYLGTTNFIDKIPARIMRPGRFSSVVEVGFPNAQARRFYLSHKLGKSIRKRELDTWVKKTNGLSIDELKEVVLSTKCLAIKFDEVLKRIRSTKDLVQKHIRNRHDEDMWDDWGNGGLVSAKVMKQLKELQNGG